VVTVAQLRAAGLGSAAISRRIASGNLIRICLGVYAVGHDGLSQEGWWMAAVFAGGAGAALSHRSAAALWEIGRAGPQIEVVTPHRPRKRAAIAFRYCRSLFPADVTRRRGIPVTTVARTLVDLTDVYRAEELAHVIHEAAYRNLFDEWAVRESLTRANGRRNLDVLHDALGLHASGSAGLRSLLERAFLGLAETAGIAEPPRINEHVQGFEVDFHWPALRLCVEIDGPGHERPAAKRRDALRDRVLEAAGWTVLRFSEEDVEQRPEAVLRALRATCAGEYGGAAAGARGDSAA
jgi:hypothetical protein